MKRKIPKFTSDEQAKAFLEQDLSDLDFSQFKPTRFEFQKKTAQINMRIPKALLEAVKRCSAARGIPPIRALFAKPLNRRFTAPKNRGERRMPLLIT
jgi:predicted DNA binding CopG/RHH family protein